MKKKIKQIEEHVNLYRDDNTGIAWIENGNTGCIVSVHPSIDILGSVRGMKSMGYWGKKDRTVRTNGLIYDIDRTLYDNNDPLEKIVYDACMCRACMERRK